MELKYTALKQLLMTALAISVGGFLLNTLPLGFNDLMEGYFRTLCVGYGLYAVANTMLLLLLYFTDYQGALWLSGIFAAGTSVFTVFSLFFSEGILWVWLSHWLRDFFSSGCDQAGCVYQETSVLYTECTAGGSRG